jgi:electron-transferring-flavoprotein dehydrogenase
VEIYPGFAGAEVLYDEEGCRRGVATGDMGIGHDGQPTDAHQPGMELLAKYTLFAEGCRGHLGKQLEEKFKLRNGADPQTYGHRHQGTVGDQAGAARQGPGDAHRRLADGSRTPTAAASFTTWRATSSRSAVVTGLGYKQPHLSPFEEFQRYKTASADAPFLEGRQAHRLRRARPSAGGLQSLPKLIFPGGALIGDDAGFLNASRIKGSHAAIKTGMLAAEALAEALGAGRSGDELTDYPKPSAHPGSTRNCTARATSSPG